MAELDCSELERLFAEAEGNGHKRNQRPIEVTLDMMDFEFVRKSNNVDELRAILRKLRSGEMGRYARLEEATEQKILSLISPADRQRIESMKTEPSTDEIRDAMMKLKHWCQPFAPDGYGEDQETAGKKSSEYTPYQVSSKCERPEIWQSADGQPDVTGFYGTNSNEFKMLPQAAKENSEEEILCMGILDIRDDKIRARTDAAAKEELLVENHTIRTVNSSLQEKIKSLIERQEIELKDLQREILKKQILSNRDRKLLAEREKQKGNESFQFGDHAEACRLYSRSLALDNTNAIVYSNRSLVQMRMKNMNCALADATVALRLDPSSIKPRYRRATIHYQIGRYDLAIEDFAACADMQPSNEMFRKMIRRCQENFQGGDKAGQSESTNLTRRTKL